MSADTNVNVNFKVNATQMKKMFGELTKLKNKVKSMSKDFTQMSNSIKKTDKSVSALNKRLKHTNKNMTSVKGKTDRTKNSLKQFGRTVKGTGKDMGVLEKETKKTGNSLGFTGLAFGFVGGIAAFAANQIRQEFVGAIQEASDVMSEMSRINLFSDTGIVGGVVDTKGLEGVQKRVFEISQDTGIAMDEVATILKNVEKAAPPDLDSKLFGDLVTGMKLLENELDSSTIAADIITVRDNFQDMELDELSDQIFTFGKANKLSFTASAKALGFAAQNAKILGSDLNELLRVTTVMANKVPGQQGNVGRALRRLGTAFQNPTTIQRLRQMGVELIGADKKFIGLEKSVSLTAAKFKQFDAENQEKGAQFLKMIGLTENARLGLLAYADANEEAKRKIDAAFSSDAIKGSFDAAVEFQKTQPAEELGKFKNSILELKIALTSGFIPAMTKLNEAFRDVFMDPEMKDAIKLFGSAIGDTLVVFLRAATAAIRPFATLMKENPGLVKTMAAAVTSLVVALSGLAIIFPLLGAFFSLHFLHEKMISRHAKLGKEASLVTRAYVRMWAAMKTGINSVGSAMRAVGAKIFAPFAPMAAKISAAFIGIGARAGVFFGTAFNIIANRVTGAGQWLSRLSGRMSARFVTMGATVGGVFGSAWAAASNAAIAAGGAVSGLIGKLAAKMGLQGGMLGLVFGGAWTAAAQGVMSASIWLQGLWKKLAVRMGLGGGLGGLSYAAGWIGSSSLAMAAKGWMTALWLKIVPLMGLGGVSAGSAFGLAFGVAAALAIAAAAVGFVDILKEVLTGQSYFKDIQKKLGVKDPQSALDILKAATGIDIKGDHHIGDGFGGIFGGGIRTRPEDQEKFYEDNPSFRPAPQEGDDAFIGPLPETSTKLDTALTGYLPKIETAVTIQHKMNDNVKKLNLEVKKEHIKVAEFTPRIEKARTTTDVLIENMSIQIIETIRNFNMMSEMTTLIAAANLMWANVIAQGNRAAGKLASLYVTDDGEFRIRDPGVSDADKALIRDARTALSTTRENQIHVEPNLEIIINPTIQVADTGDKSVTEISDTINDGIASGLQKYAGSLGL